MQSVLRKQTLLHTRSTTAAMALASSSSSSLFFSNPNPNPNPNPKPKPNRSFVIFSPCIPRRSTAITSSPFSSLSEKPSTDDLQDNNNGDNFSEKRSLAVATGELFIGIASRLISKSISRVDLGEKLEDGQRIANVVEDSLQPEVVWEQREKDVEAEKRRKMVTSPGFSFSAAGLLFPYHLGVAQFLIENGYIKETTPLAGASAGAIVCAVIASGSSMEDALQATKILAEDCRLRGTAFRLGAVLRDVLDKVLPDDVHIRCNGRIRVAVTQIIWRPRGMLIDQFDSKEDLINALFTSSFIPGYLAPRPVTMFRNRLCIDGGLTLFMPPTSATQTVRICAFPASSLRIQGIGISPDCNPENKLSNRQLLSWALEPADDHMLDKLFEFGYSDAAVWARENPVNMIVKEDTPVA